MNENIPELVLSTIKTIADSTAQTTNGIAKIKEIQRTTGITKKQKKKLERELEFNLQASNEFKNWCDQNPGYLYEAHIGNIKLTNLNTIFNYAKLEFDKTESVPQQELEQEWLLKFLDVSGETSDIEKQQILAKVFAGQLKKPSCISYRTLNILKHISKEEIEIFKKALSCSFYNNNMLFIARGKECLDYFKFGEIMRLEECGLMESSGMKLFQGHGDIRLVSSTKKYLVRIISEQQEKIKLSCYYFTSAGRELYDILNINEAPQQIIIDYAKLWNSDKNKVSVHKYMYEENGASHYDIDEII